MRWRSEIGIGNGTIAMKIQDGRLVGENIDHVESPNRGGRFVAGAPDTIVLHFTAGRSHQTAVDTLTDPARKVSSHLVVGGDGGISQLLSFDVIGWHAGESAWEGRTALNNYSIGIEIDNAGQLEERDGGLFSWFGQEYPEEEMVRGVHRNQTEATCWHRYPDVQLQAVDELCRLLVTAYGITYILGHEEISPERKIDPGPAFPLDELRRRLLSPPLAALATPAEGRSTGLEAG